MLHLLPRDKGGQERGALSVLVLSQGLEPRMLKQSHLSLASMLHDSQQPALAS